MKHFIIFLTLSIINPQLILAQSASKQQSMVVTSHPLATEVGLELLNKGGNAADAACAVGFALSVVEQYSSGIGGGGFALAYFNNEAHNNNSNKKAVKFLDFRERAPFNISPNSYLDKKGLPQKHKPQQDGIFSVATPGAVKGYLEIQEKYGLLKRKDCLRPAIRLAKKGFKIDTRFQKYTEWRKETLLKDNEAKALLFNCSTQSNQEICTTKKLGTTFIQKDLSKTLMLISKHGAKTMYGKGGKLLQRLLQDMEQRKGWLKEEDFLRYKTHWRKPLKLNVADYIIYSSPPPSSGGQILLTLMNILQHEAPTGRFNDPAWLMKYIEASRFAYADRALLGDPDFNKDSALLLEKLLSPQRGKDIYDFINHPTSSKPLSSKNIKAGMFSPFALPTKEHQTTNESEDTAHFSIVDKFGNAVAITTTVNYGWGSGVIAKGTGMVWNDEMDDFAIAPGIPNAYGIVGTKTNTILPGKTPLSSMAPTLVFKSKKVNDLVDHQLHLHQNLYIVAGSPGGSRIPSTVFQILNQILFFNASAKEAVNYRRLHFQHLPEKVFTEKFALDAVTKDTLQKNGYTLEERSQWSNAQVIIIHDDGTKEGASDFRGIGSVGVSDN